MEEPKLTINDKEIALIKKTFCDNEFLLKAVRALFLGLEVTDEEKTVIKSTFSDKELLALMWKRFYPQLSKDTPIGQSQDVWLGVEQMIFGQPKEVIYQAVQYKAEALKMTKQALGLLENPSEEALDISYSPELTIKDDYQVKLLARNQFIKHVETQLMYLQVIAGKKEETEEQAKARLTKNSSK